MRNHLAKGGVILRALRRVFSEPLYGLFALTAWMLSFGFLALLPNLAFVQSVLVSPHASPAAKFALIFLLFAGTPDTVGFAGFLSLILAGFLFGVNMALVAYNVRRKR